MRYTDPAPATLAAGSTRSLTTPKWTARKEPHRPMRALPLTRRYEVSWLDEDGEVADFTRIAPALPVFEDAFAAFAHGVLIQTTEGPVAVEDLQPGTHLACPNGRVTTLRWKGAITLVPGAPQTGDRPDRLYRFTADSFGLARPSRDLLLGPRAHLLNRAPAVRAAIGTEAALTPASAFVDGVSVIEVTPVTPVRVYHLVCDGHATILASGIEVESYHPAAEAALSMSSEMRTLFLSLFPHLDTLESFGRTLWPRLAASEMAEIA